MWQQAALLMVVSIGATFVIIAGELDLSIGAIGRLVSVVVPSLLAAGSPMPIAVLLALVIGAAVGLANAAITLRLQVPSFITTLGTMAIVSGLAVMVSLTPLTVTSSSFAAVFTNRIYGAPLTGIYALAAVAAAAWFFPTSRFGFHVRAVGSGETSAVLQGVRARRVKYLVFVTAGVLSAVGGGAAAVPWGLGPDGRALRYCWTRMAAGVAGLHDEDHPRSGRSYDAVNRVLLPSPGYW